MRRQSVAFISLIWAPTMRGEEDMRAEEAAQQAIEHKQSRALKAASAAHYSRISLARRQIALVDRHFRGLVGEARRRMGVFGKVL